MGSAETIGIGCGDLSLEVTPRHGGCILSFERSGFELMRRATLPLDVPSDAACFPLVPFSGRIDHAQFSWLGETYTISASSNRAPHAIHGHGLKAEWEVDRHGRTSLHLSYEHRASDWPFPYRAWQFFELGEDALIATIGLQNEGHSVMPAGMGLHPYFNRNAAVRLTAKVDEVYLPDATNIPRERAPVPPEIDFSDHRPVSELSMDHNFGDWNRTALIEWVEAGQALEIHADQVFGHLVVYVPPGENYFCVEPVSHVADAVNMIARGVDGTGLVSLEPGQALQGSIRFVPRTL